jgi:hypothetical protein
MVKRKRDRNTQAKDSAREASLLWLNPLLPFPGAIHGLSQARRMSRMLGLNNHDDVFLSWLMTLDALTLMRLPTPSPLSLERAFLLQTWVW